MSVWYPCIYCTDELKCTKNTGDGVISFCVLGPCRDETPSNADRLRKKSDEELAVFLANVSDHGGGSCAPGHYGCTNRDNCVPCWLEWLREEAQDES